MAFLPARQAQGQPVRPGRVGARSCCCRCRRLRTAAAEPRAGRAPVQIADEAEALVQDGLALRRPSLPVVKKAPPSSDT